MYTKTITSSIQPNSTTSSRHTPNPQPPLPTNYHPSPSPSQSIRSSPPHSPTSKYRPSPLSRSGVIAISDGRSSSASTSSSCNISDGKSGSTSGRYEGSHGLRNVWRMRVISAMLGAGARVGSTRGRMSSSRVWTCWVGGVAVLF